MKSISDINLKLRNMCIHMSDSLVVDPKMCLAHVKHITSNMYFDITCSLMFRSNTTGKGFLDNNFVYTTILVLGTSQDETGKADDTTHHNHNCNNNSNGNYCAGVTAIIVTCIMGRTFCG